MEFRLQYEMQGCGRCGGTGYYWYGPQAQKGVCFKCGGSGRVLSRRGIYAQTAAHKLIQQFKDSGVDIMSLSREQLEQFVAIKGLKIVRIKEQAK